MPADRALGLLLAAFLVPACRVPDAKVWNLRQLHEFDGTPARRGNVKSDFRYVVDRLLTSSGLTSAEALQGGESSIEDPWGRCLANLNGLAHCGTDERTLFLQAEMFGWLAVDDPYPLSRERAAAGLGAVGEALGIGSPAPFDPDQEPARPADVGAALTELLRAVQPALDGGDDPALQPALAAACAAAGALPYDRDGARRMLSATTSLLDRAPAGAGGADRRGDGGGGEGWAALAALRRQLAAATVRYALASTLSDPDERVRAAGVEAVSRVQGHDDARLLLAALADKSPLVLERAVRLLRRHGFPAPAGAAPEDLARLRETFLAQLVRCARHRDGPVSVAACRALGDLSGSGVRSLRPEVWSRWWDATSAAAPEGSADGASAARPGRPVEAAAPGGGGAAP